MMNGVGCPSCAHIYHHWGGSVLRTGLPRAHLHRGRGENQVGCTTSFPPKDRERGVHPLLPFTRVEVCGINSHALDSCSFGPNPEEGKGLCGLTTPSSAGVDCPARVCPSGDVTGHSVPREGCWVCSKVMSLDCPPAAVPMGPPALCSRAILLPRAPHVHPAHCSHPGVPRHFLPSRVVF